MGAVGFSKQQELEADANGMILAAKAGYDPDAALAFEGRLQAIDANREQAQAPPGTIVGEAGGALVKSLETYFRTHPAAGAAAAGDAPGDRPQRRGMAWQDVLHRCAEL